MSTTTDPSTSDVDSQTTGLIINLSVGSVTVIASVIAFDLLRKRVQPVFEARRELNQSRANLDYHGRRVYSPPSPSFRWLGWVGPLLRLELDTIAETHGLDTALFLRYLRAMAVLFLFLCIPSVVLLVVYFTASNKDLPDTETARTVGVEKFSLANVPSDDPWRFWVTLGVEYFIFFFICWYLWTQFSTYSKDRRRYRSSNNPANYAILVQDIPRQSRSEQAVFQYWSKLFPEQVSRVYFVYDGSKLVVKRQKFWDAVKKRERAEWDLRFSKKLDGSRPSHKTGACSFCRGNSARVDSIAHWAEQQEHYGTKIALYQEEMNLQHFRPTSAAVVVFKTRQAAAIAAQTHFPSRESEWRVTRAPEPNAINWDALSISGWQVPYRQGLTILFSILLTLFWVIPVTAIMGLANISTLSKIEINGQFPFSFLEGLAGKSPFVLGILESYLPAIILSVFLSLVPTFLRIFVNISRVSSLGRVDSQVRDWYFNFNIFSNFLFVSFGATLLTDSVIPQIAEKPSKTVDLLAEAFPKQAAFMMNFVLLKALSATPLELLQLARIVVRAVMLKFVARTPREKNEVNTGNTLFVFLRYYAMAQLVALLGIIYCTIQPFFVPVCFVYYTAMYIVWKYNLCFSMHNPYQDGGYMHGGALYGVWVGLFLHLLTMIGLFGANKNPAQSVLIIIPAFLSVLFYKNCRKSFSRVVEHGSLVETMLRAEDEGDEMITENMVAKFLHPGFEPLPDPIENLSGVDESTGEVKYSDIEDLESPLGGLGGRDDKPLSRPPNSTSTDDWKDAQESAEQGEGRTDAPP